MDLFDQEYKNSYLKYHTNPIPTNSLDPRAWFYPPQGGDPILNPTIKMQIFKDIDYINAAEEMYTRNRVHEYVMVGPALKENSSEKAPFTIIVQINPTNLSDLLKEKILNHIKEINGRLAVGTQHPIHYIPTIRKIDLENYDYAYHPYTEKWVKKPKQLGEARTDLDKIYKDPTKRKPKQSLKRGLRKLTTI